MAATAETVRGNISDASGGGGKENKPEPSDSGRQQSINNDDSQQSKQGQASARCFACRKSLAHSAHLINVAGQEHCWHPECFKCNICQHALEHETSCHVYRENIVCKLDYARIKREHARKCCRCRWPIEALDWVRKVDQFVYHLACFSCDLCRRQLNTGEQFTIDVKQSSTKRGQVKILCRRHFITDQQQPCEMTNQLASRGATNIRGQLESSSSYPYLQQQQQQLMLGQPAPQESAQVHSRSSPLIGQTAPRARTNLESPELAIAKSAINFSDQQLELMDANSPEAQHHFDMMGRRQLVNPTASSSSNGSHSPNQTGNGSGIMAIGSSKSKRVRTTFSEDQLSLLQTRFQIDSNPDGQDLELIAAATGLSKRVTQVWFQNSRARQKKHLIKRKPQSQQQQQQALTTSGDLDPSSFVVPNDFQGSQFSINLAPIAHRQSDQQMSHHFQSSNESTLQAPLKRGGQCWQLDSGHQDGTSRQRGSDARQLGDDDMQQKGNNNQSDNDIADDDDEDEIELDESDGGASETMSSFSSVGAEMTTPDNESKQIGR